MPTKKAPAQTARQALGSGSTTQNTQTENEYSGLGTYSPDRSGWSTDFHLRTLPTITALTGHGKHHPRAGFEQFPDCGSEFKNAISGFLLSKAIFERYEKASTLQGRYEAIFDGVVMAANASEDECGILQGFVAHIVAVIEGYASLAQNSPSAQENFQ